MTNGKRKTVVVTHKCCYGFERVPGEMGCSKMVMKPLAETVADLGAEEFLDLVEVLDMKPVLEQNVTLFVPSDEAIEDFRLAKECSNALLMEEQSQIVSDCSYSGP